MFRGSQNCNLQTCLSVGKPAGIKPEGCWASSFACGHPGPLAFTVLSDMA